MLEFTYRLILLGGRWKLSFVDSQYICNVSLKTGKEIGKDWCEDFSSEKNVCATSTALSHKALHYAHLPPFYCCSKIESTAHNKSLKLSQSSGELSKAPFSWNYSSHWPTFHCKLVKQKSRCKNKWNSNNRVGFYKCISAQEIEWITWLYTWVHHYCINRRQWIRALGGCQVFPCLLVIGRLCLALRVG